MSLPKAIAAAERLSAAERAVLAFYLETLDDEDRPASATTAAERKAPKTAAQRQHEKRERERMSRDASRNVVTPVVTFRDDVTQTVTENVTPSVTGRDGSRDGVTPRAPASELSSPSGSLSFTEKAEERREERERAGASARDASHAPSRSSSRGVTRTVTRGITQHVTRDVTENVTDETGDTRHAENVRAALVAGYKKANVPPPMKYLSVPAHGPVLDIARSIEPKDVGRFVEGFFANARARKEGFPIHFAAASPGQYLVEPQRQRSSTPIGLLETDEEFEADFKRIQEASERTRAASFAALAEEQGRTNA